MNLPPNNFDSWPTHLNWSDDELWQSRLASDRDRAFEHQSSAQLRITNLLQERAIASGAVAFALTGSTARAKRTKISDLDYHVIGRRPPHDDLPDDVDIYATDEIGMWRKLSEGDDFIQWTLRYGCILFDQGVFQAAMQRVSSAELWPTSTQKLSRLGGHISLARRLIAIGDRDAAQDQVRATLTSLSRALLLDARVFPRARAELPVQLAGIGADGLGSALLATICDEPDLETLSRSLDLAESLATPKASNSPLRSAG